jgi:hypothetical protein
MKDAANEIERLRAAIVRLGASETMTLPFMIDDSQTGKELQARIQFARDTFDR